MTRLKKKNEVKKYKKKESFKNSKLPLAKKVSGWLRQHDYGGGNQYKTKVFLFFIITKTLSYSVIYFYLEYLNFLSFDSIL